MGSAEIYFLTDVDNADGPSRKAERLLVRQAVAGDRFAFQQIVERNEQRMFSVARGVLGRGMAGDVEDVVQEAFIKAYRALPDFRGDAGLSTWLYRITYLTAIDQQRQLLRHQQLAKAIETEADCEAHLISGSIISSGASELESVQLRQEIDAAMATLTRFEQTIFTLRHMQNFRLREIAVIVDCAEGTVKNILFRAIRKLRDYLQDSQHLVKESDRC